MRIGALVKICFIHSNQSRNRFNPKFLIYIFNETGNYILKNKNKKKDNTRQNKIRQDKARQEKTKQNKINLFYLFITLYHFTITSNYVIKHQNSLHRG